MERRLAAILAADVVGYSRLIGADETATLTVLKSHRKDLFEPKIAGHKGRIVKLMGDGLLAEFPSAVEAVQCAVQIQLSVGKRSPDLPEDHRINYRIGINIGDIVVEDDDIYGDGVNVAARLEGLAEPGGLCISRNVFNQVKDKLDLTFDHLGEKEVKNIAEPVSVYRVVFDEKAASLVTAASDVSSAPFRRRWPKIAAAAALVLVITIGGAVFWQPWRPDVEPAAVERMAFPLPEKPSIAVLPFENLGGDPDQEYFADALAEDLITELSRFSEFFVIASNSSFAYEGEPVSVREVAEDLGVRYVLEGSVRKSSDGLRVTAQLIDAMFGTHVWAERYDRALDDLFAIQDEIVERIAGALGGPGGRIELEERARASRKNSPDLTAYDYYLRGREAFARFTAQGFSEARQMYERAIELDADFAHPYKSLAWIDILELKWGRTSDPEGALERAHQLAQKAATLDPDDYGSHWALGVVYMWKRQHAQAIAEYERALALNPNNANLHAEMADALTYVGRADESVELATKAIRLNPNYPDWYLWNLAAGYFLSGKYEDALSVLKKMRNPADAHRLLAATYAQLGRLEEAQAEAMNFLAINPEFSIARWAATQPYENPAYFAPYVEGLRKAGLPEHPPLALPAKPSIAVLAFDDLSQGADRDYLSDAIAEGIITELSRFPELFVIARNSSFHYRDTATDVRKISRELGVRYILEGSQQKAGEELRVTVQLIDAVAGNHVWAETYDRELADIFTVQDEIANSVASTLGEKLRRLAGEEARRADPARLRAFENVLKGQRHFLEFTQEDSEKARRSYLAAIKADPTLARAHSSLAWIHINGYRWGWTDLDREEALVYARDEAGIALQLAPQDYASHFAMAAVHMQVGEREQAIAEFKKSLSLNPNAGDVMASFAEVLGYSGRFPEAVEWLQKAMRLDPHHPEWYYWNLGWAQYSMGECEAALTTMRRMSRLPHFANRTLAATYVCLGRLDEARAAIATLLEHDPEYNVAKFRLNFGGKYKDPADLESWINDLRVAGLPE